MTELNRHRGLSQLPTFPFLPTILPSRKQHVSFVYIHKLVIFPLGDSQQCMSIWHFPASPFLYCMHEDTYFLFLPMNILISTTFPLYIPLGSVFHRLKTKMDLHLQGVIKLLTKADENSFHFSSSLCLYATQMHTLISLKTIKSKILCL